MAIVGKLGVAMRGAVDDVIGNMTKLRNDGKFIDSNVFNISLKLFSKKEPSLKMNLSREILSLSIDQDFIENFTDQVTLEVELDMQEAIILYRMRNELMGGLMIDRAAPTSPFMTREKTAFFGTSIPEWAYRVYRVVVINLADIYKKIPAEMITPRSSRTSIPDYMQKTVTARLELIPVNVYNARKILFSTIASGCLMSDMLKYVVTAFGFKKAAIVPPDNKRVYTNFVIPPSYRVENIMSFLQTGPGMGVYNNGFCSYITEDCWFVWPRYGVPLAARPLTVYAVGGDSKFSALRRASFTDPETGNRSLLLTSEVNETNWSILGSENATNGANIHITSCLMDKCRSLRGDENWWMNPQIYNFVSIPTDVVSSEKFINMKYVMDHGNVFKIKSEAGSFQTTTLDFTWNNAEPYFFTPSCSVVYVYDSIDGMKTLQTTCEHVEYVFSNQREVSKLYPYFTCTAAVRLCSLNKTAKDRGNV